MLFSPTKLLTAALAALPLLASLGNAQAMVMIREGDTVVLAGPVVAEDGDKFRRLLAQGPLTRVILLGSRGGSMSGGLSVANQIRAQGINTVVAGPCSSSCAVIFMGGVERQMMGGKTLAQTRLGFHGPHNHTTKAVTARGADQMYDWLEKKSDGKFSGELLDRAMRITHAGDILFFYYTDPQQSPDQPGVVFCPEHVRLRSLCQQFPGVDAFSAGVLTTRTLFPPDTPIYATALAAQPPQEAASAPQEPASGAPVPAQK